MVNKKSRGKKSKSKQDDKIQYLLNLSRNIEVKRFEDISPDEKQSQPWKRILREYENRKRAYQVMKGKDPYIGEDGLIISSKLKYYNGLITLNIGHKINRENLYSEKVEIDVVASLDNLDEYEVFDYLNFEYKRGIPENVLYLVLRKTNKLLDSFTQQLLWMTNPFHLIEDIKDKLLFIPSKSVKLHLKTENGKLKYLGIGPADDRTKNGKKKKKRFIEIIENKDPKKEEYLVRIFLEYFRGNPKHKEHTKRESKETFDSYNVTMDYLVNTLDKLSTHDEVINYSSLIAKVIILEVSKELHYNKRVNTYLNFSDKDNEYFKDVGEFVKKYWNE